MQFLKFAAAIVALIFFVPSASAHFIWLVTETGADGSEHVHVRFGEDAFDEGAEFLNRLNGLKVYQVSGTESAIPLKLSPSNLSDTAALDHETVLVTSHEFGVMNRGGTSFRLQYYAKTGPQISSPAWRTAKTADDLRLDIVPGLRKGKLRVRVKFDGKPARGSQVKAARPGLDDFEGETNDKGVVVFPIAEDGLYSIRVRHIEATAGKVAGKAFTETRHYSTVSVLVDSSDGHSVVAEQLQALPQPVTSFGAAVLDSKLYMYGGHTGRAHSYAKEDQSNQLTRLDLQTGKWSTVLQGPHLQGLALVADGTQLYRLGGFTAENAGGEDHHLVSQDTVESFHPDQAQWVALPSLPEPRSSFDAAVVNNAIVVVGGWAMNGDQDRIWHKTAWKMDLTAKERKWEPIANPPFQRRALAVAAHNGKLYAIGGMQKEGGPTTAVDIYDFATNQWSEGPALFVSDEKPEDGDRMSMGKMAGFGASAFATGDRLYVSTVQGILQTLSTDGSKWEVVKNNLSPRFFHRMLPVDDHSLIMVGGSNMSIGKFEEVEVISVK